MTENSGTPAPKRSRLRVLLLVLGGLFLALVALVIVAPFLPHRWFHNHPRVEPTEGLDKIKSGAYLFYKTDRYDSHGNLLPRRFPRSTPMTPPRPPCDRAVTPKAQWDLPGWMELKFYIEDRHYASFRFQSTGTGAAAVFTARSHTDLDCDGDLSTFELRGSIDEQGEVKVVGPIVWDEFE